MTYRLDDHFTIKKLIVMSLPAIMQMIFISIYSIVDGFFISNYCGRTAFSGINIIWPYAMILSSFGFMIGAGGTALVAKTLGEGKRELASKIFSMMFYFVIILGLINATISFIFVRQIAYFLGARDELLDYAVRYGRFLIGFNLFFMIQSFFHNFYIVAERPKLGFISTLIAGCFNMILDFLFVGVFKWDVEGAGLATGLSYILGSGIGLFYFLFNKSTNIKLTSAKFNFAYIRKACFNGSSELVSNISMSIVSILFNMQLLHYIGESGVAAYGIIMYVSFIFIAVFIGFNISTAPVIGYNYGSKNKEELQNVSRKCFMIVAICGIIMTFLTFSLSYPLSLIFASQDKELLKLSTHAIRIYSFMFLFSGITYFASSFFTALNNGLVSVLISGTRTIIFQIGCILILPLIFKSEGIWYSMVASEVLAISFSLIFLISQRKKYEY